MGESLGARVRCVDASRCNEALLVAIPLVLDGGGVPAYRQSNDPSASGLSKPQTVSPIEIAQTPGSSFSTALGRRCCCEARNANAIVTLDINLHVIGYAKFVDNVCYANAVDGHRMMFRSVARTELAVE